VITTAAVLIAALAIGLIIVRATQRPGRHRDHGHPGATPNYAAILATWNRTNRHDRPTT
jgi:hypothetical protein